MLELFARKTSDYVWHIDEPLILDYLEAGGSLDDISRFLEENAAEPIPHTIDVWFDDLRTKAGVVMNLEEAILIEFQDPAVTVLVAHHAKT